MMKQTGSDVKTELLEIIAFLYRRVKHDKCTAEEMESFARIISEQMTVWASPKDLARFYGQSESNVRNVIARNYIPKEEEKIGGKEYNIGFFAKIKPSTWRRKSSK